MHMMTIWPKVVNEVMGIVLNPATQVDVAAINKISTNGKSTVFVPEVMKEEACPCL